jgi:hypothetical protein
VRVYYKEDGQTGHGNSECEYSSWLENSDVDSEESPSAQGMPPKPKDTCPCSSSSTGTNVVGRCLRSAQTPGQHQSQTRPKEKTQDEGQLCQHHCYVACLTCSDVGHIGTQGASESREKARAHSKKLINSMIARTKHVDNPPPWDVGTEEDFCT